MKEVFNEFAKLGWKASSKHRFLCMSNQSLQLLNQLPDSWKRVLATRVDRNVWTGLDGALARARSEGTCYPPAGMELTALCECEPHAVKVVILGQDPYHGAGQAHGLAFSVMSGVTWPPSLRNLLKELLDDVGPENQTLNKVGHQGALQHWSQQGVLLLNDVLSVAHGSPGSHVHFGWQMVTGAVLDVLQESDRPIVFILWGSQARKHKKNIDHPDHLVLESPHPSPLSAYRGFFGSKPFSLANAWLVSKGLEPISW